jgi:hypothetical protein
MAWAHSICSCCRQRGRLPFWLGPLLLVWRPPATTAAGLFSVLLVAGEGASLVGRVLGVEAEQDRPRDAAAATNTADAHARACNKGPAALRGRHALKLHHD